jgi:hypothetical protein
MNDNQTNQPAGAPDQKTPKSRRKGGIGGFFRWFFRFRIILIFLLLVISLPVFMIIYGIVLPAKNYKPTTGVGTVSLSDTAHSHSSSMTGTQLEEVRKIIALENERAFQKNRLALAENDSVYFILDVPDSALWLEIKGVPVRKTHVRLMEVSNRFSLISHENLLPWISEPFTLQSDMATIPKMPIVVKQAPKDTIEAQKSAAPNPIETTPVFFTLYFDRNLVIEIEQADLTPEQEELEAVMNYKEIKRKESNRSMIETLRNPQQPNRLLPIRIVIDEADARAIYRAIPTKTHLLLKL